MTEFPDALHEDCQQLSNKTFVFLRDLRGSNVLELNELIVDMCTILG